MSKLPETGFLRLKQIIGDPKAEPPISGLLPMSKSSWWDGVKKGIFPKPIKMGPNMTAWRVEDIAELIARLGAQCTGNANA
ncbi:transcriptional regulator [Methylomonas koyamae]|uniref:Transcriptional regulator n=1 Tax=Methylomonas koyamae TaxID=702114 RepID=A0A177N344_9GAMM|nr:AlpA family phage regulatory protein [Methylomonas koyamae]OAI12074.1 transcriptional regulator [Methylomonas koyamae]